MSSAPASFQTLSIIIPAYNERATIEKVVSAVASAGLALQREIVIVDDFSSDGTREILQRLQPPPGATLKVVMHEHNQGKGAAIRTGLAHISGDIVLVQDADLEYDPADYP